LTGTCGFGRRNPHDFQGFGIHPKSERALGFLKTVSIQSVFNLHLKM